MPIAAVCDICGTTDSCPGGKSLPEFLEILQKKGWRIEEPKTTCPPCAQGHQEVLEGGTVITYGIHEVRHSPGRWTGIYWLWQKGGGYGYRGLFHLPEEVSFTSEREAKEYAKAEGRKKIRSAEWP